MGVPVKYKYLLGWPESTFELVELVFSELEKSANALDYCLDEVSENRWEILSAKPSFAQMVIKRLNEVRVGCQDIESRYDSLKPGRPPMWLKVTRESSELVKEAIFELKRLDHSMNNGNRWGKAQAHLENAIDLVARTRKEMEAISNSRRVIKRIQRKKRKG